MVEFNKVSNESYFIKNLLYSTYLPLLRTVRENDYIIKGRMYIYKCNIIKCTSSGYIPIKNANYNMDEYPKQLLRKSDDEKVIEGQVYYNRINGNLSPIIGIKGDTRCPRALGWLEENIADFDILGEYHFGEMNGKFCSNFLSSSEGYDYKTHEKLGHYLRSLRDMYELNLMPLYNCFSNQPLRNIHIGDNKVEVTNKEYYTKVFKVPIRFNTDYTICMENVGMTTFAPAFIRHGNLLMLNNNRYGNNVDATNKYIKLNHDDVIHNMPNLRFKQPFKLRFDNIPRNKVVNYTKTTYTKIASEYTAEYYRLNPGASPAYVRTYYEDDETYRSYDYNNLDMDGRANYQQGYKYSIHNPEGGLLPSESLLPDNTLILPSAEFIVAQVDEDTFNNNKEKYYTFTNNDYEQCTNESVYDDSIVYYTYYGGLYECINPSIGTFETVTKSYKKCPEDETLFNRTIFNNNKTKYYTLVDGAYVRCTSSSVYDENEIYYYINTEHTDCWYEFNNQNEFVPTQDTYIKPGKQYYRKEMTEVPFTFNYDITEENCSMYDFIEDELYLLIQVPSTYEPNIVIIEGDYTDFPKEFIFDDTKFEHFSNDKLDHLFTNNLILMETATKKVRPFSPTLMQFLLWNAICNLDTINNDMDRIAMNLPVRNPNGEFNNNYWYDRYREAVFDYANEFQRKYIRDNLGYVTKDIERIIEDGNYYEYPEGPVMQYIDENV